MIDLTGANLVNYMLRVVRDVMERNPRFKNTLGEVTFSANTIIKWKDVWVSITNVSTTGNRLSPDYFMCTQIGRAILAKVGDKDGQFIEWTREVDPKRAMPDAGIYYLNVDYFSDQTRELGLTVQKYRWVEGKLKNAIGTIVYFAPSIDLTTVNLSDAATSTPVEAIKYNQSTGGFAYLSTPTTTLVATYNDGLSSPAWNVTVQYDPGTVVTYGGTAYIAAAPSMGQPPTNVLYWTPYSVFVPKAGTRLAPLTDYWFQRKESVVICEKTISGTQLCNIPLQGVGAFGVWKDSVSYVPGQTVSFAGNTYIAVVSSLNNPPLASPRGNSFPVTNVSIVGNSLTVTADNTLVPGQTTTFFGLTNATFLNSEAVIVLSASSTQFTAAFTHADYSAVESSGAASIVIDTTVYWQPFVATTSYTSVTVSDQDEYTLRLGRDYTFQGPQWIMTSAYTPEGSTLYANMVVKVNPYNVVANMPENYLQVNLGPNESLAPNQVFIHTPEGSFTNPTVQADGSLLIPQLLQPGDYMRWEVRIDAGEMQAIAKKWEITNLPQVDPNTIIWSKLGPDNTMITKTQVQLMAGDPTSRVGFQQTSAGTPLLVNGEAVPILPGLRLAIGDNVVVGDQCALIVSPSLTETYEVFGSKENLTFTMEVKANDLQTASDLGEMLKRELLIMRRTNIEADGLTIFEISRGYVGQARDLSATAPQYIYTLNITASADWKVYVPLIDRLTNLEITEIPGQTDFLGKLQMAPRMVAFGSEVFIPSYK